MERRIGGVIQNMNNVLKHFFRVYYPTLPEIIRAGRKTLFAPIIDASVFIRLKPSMLLIHLSQFRQTVSSCSDPHIGIVEIMQGLFNCQRDRCLALVIIERIFRSGILEEISQVVLTGRNIPSATKIITTHNFRGFEI